MKASEGEACFFGNTKINNFKRMHNDCEISNTAEVCKMTTKFQDVVSGCQGAVMWFLRCSFSM